MSLKTKELRLHGIGVSPGIALGPAAFRAWGMDEPTVEAITPDAIESEWQRLESALETTKSEIQKIQEKVMKDAGAQHAGIFEAHMMMLEDKAVLAEVRKTLEDRLICVEAAYHQVLDRYAEALSKIGDEYLSDRSIDIHDVTRRVLQALAGTSHAEHPKHPHILLTHDLAPSDTAAINPDLVLGFATEIGSPTSHTAIVARSLGIPAVVGLHKLPPLRWGQQVLLDGYKGLIIVDPNEATIAAYDKIREEKAEAETKLAEFRDRRSRTKDGRHVVLSANIEFYQEMALVVKNGGEGVGLYRTEFFYLDDGRLPTEDEQTANYKRVADACGDAGVIIRTFDLGGDKLLEKDQIDVEPEPNPFLGWRGIRVSLSEREVFKTQLRAILKASAKRKVRVMYPLVSVLEELREANRILDECKRELDSEDVDFDPDIETGVMIEVPSAAMIASQLAKEVDFFSFGTNDLVQYSLAVDRINERVAGLYQPCHPGVLALMKLAIDAGHQEGIWSGVCGEMASDVALLPLLIGLGVDELSVGANQLPRVKFAVRQLDSPTCEKLAHESLHLGEAAEIRSRSEELAKECYPELFN